MTVKHVRSAVLAALVIVSTLGGVALASTASAVNEAPTVASLRADVNDFSFESFDGRYYLEKDDSGRASLRVVETIVAIFPDYDQNRGIIRALPLKNGETPLDVTVRSVEDETGAPVPYERSDYDGFAELALGTNDFVHGRTTYVIEYTMRDVIRAFEDSGGEEFYWDINGDGWQQTFGTVSATVLVSPELASGLTGDASCYVGLYGESTECAITRDGSTFTSSSGPVWPYNTLTVAIGFESGTVVQPTLPRDNFIVQVLPKLLLGLMVLWVVLSIVLRSLFWRDAKGRGTVIAQFEPPEGSDLLLDAELIGRRSSGLTAMLIDFAVRGMVRVIDATPDDATAKRRFELELLTADGANAREKRVLIALFGKKLETGKRVNPAALKASDGASLYAMTASTASFAASEGYRAKPVTKVPKYITRASLFTWLAFAPVWTWAVWNEVLGGEVVLPALASTVLALVVPAVLALPLRLTSKGAEAKEYLEGLRLYLTVAEEERMRMLQSPLGALRIDINDKDAIVKLNERLLPYAVLWGVEDQWVEQLRASGEPPAWLESSDYSPQLFHSFATASTSSVRPIVTTSSSSGSSWSSSSSSSFSSGSSGGGFSGGGGGGGGGGGR